MQGSPGTQDSVFDFLVLNTSLRIGNEKIAAKDKKTIAAEKIVAIMS